MKPMKTKMDVTSAILASKEYDEAKERLANKPSGYHPSDLAITVQKRKRDRDSWVNELRESFQIIQGGKED